ncbi:DNA methyltransferase [Aquamicrobium soli]|uniref:site-specific DNA-methyltransferase (adenine-specific) n=1 Tax=Aquamicrobium soli TaxID=1811518 RepID=A0ABV7KD65_9HYPH
MSIHPDYRQFLDGRVTLFGGDCLDVLDRLPENSVDAVVTDPPYHLTSIVKRFGAEGAAEAKEGVTGAFKRASAGFMGKQWDGGDVAFQAETWRKVLRVLKPGGYILAFASTRGFGRMSVAIEDAGFVTHPLIDYLFDDTPEILRFLQSLSFEQLEAFVRLVDQRDGGMLHWIFGSGFPKSTRIKAEGFDAFRYGGQALKPAIEPIYMGQKPFSEANGTANILKHGTGALNIDGCRVSTDDDLNGGTYSGARRLRDVYTSTDSDPVAVPLNRLANGAGEFVQPTGRWPANVIHDGSDEVLAAFPDAPGQQREVNDTFAPKQGTAVYGDYGPRPTVAPRDHGGSAARFFYTAKADAEDRIGSKHPTVKPLDLIQYLCRLVTPPGGTVLDPFAGTGTTGEAAWREGFNAVLIERETEYQADIARRMDLAIKPTKRAAVAKSKGKLMGAEGTPLFGGDAA